MGIYKALSTCIDIFPISFDRSKGFEYTCYKWERNETPLNGLEHSEQEYINQNTYLYFSASDSAPSFNDKDLSKYYTQTTEETKTNLKASYTNGRILSEKNISKLIRSLTDNNAFVVNASITGTECTQIEFIIEGRYFALDLASINSSSNQKIPNNGNLWVGIHLADPYVIGSATDEYEMLYAYDTEYSENAQYDGLANIDFSDAPLSDNQYSCVLQLLEKMPDGTLRVPIKSEFQFTTNRIKNISGGTV